MRRLLGIIMVAATVAACGDSTSPDSETNVSGTYTLRTVNGQNLPFPILVVGTTYRLEVTTATLTVNSNGTYSESTTLRETDGTSTTTQTDNTSGTWTRTNNAVSFRDTADGTIVTGSAAGNTLTFVEDGLTLVFQK